MILQKHHKSDSGKELNKMKKYRLLLLTPLIILAACNNADTSVSENSTTPETTITENSPISTEKEITGMNEIQQEVNETDYTDYRAIAYVTVPASENWRWIGTDDENGVVSAIDTRYVTHINFAFGMLEAYQYDSPDSARPLMDGRITSPLAYFNPADEKYHYRATLNGWIEEMNNEVDGRVYLKALVELKKQKPDLKVLLSVGGWNCDGFCYMARTEEGRSEFIESCIKIIHEYGIDGIDLDWEYPTNGAWGEIAWCKDCVSDARALLNEFRITLNNEFPDEYKLLTIASGTGQSWVDTKTFEALDYINVMCYDFEPGSGGNQSGLEKSATFMKEHANKVGNTAENRRKLNLGVPFYNEGGPYLVPFHKPFDGHIDTSPEILEEKMKWVRDNGYGGAFYWAYSMDIFEQDVEDPNDENVKILQRTVYKGLNPDA